MQVHRRPLRVLFLISFISIAGFSIIVPFFPIYANDLLFPVPLWGITLGVVLQIGIITAASKFIQMFLTPAFGELSDELSRKPIMVTGLFLYSGIMSGYALVDSFEGFLILRLIQGIATASVWTIGEALVVDLSPEEEKGKQLGNYTFSMFAGLTVGPFLGYVFYTGFHHVLNLSELNSYQYTFLSVGLLSLVVAIMAQTLIHEKEKIKTSYRVILAQMAYTILVSPKILYRALRSEDYPRNRSIYGLYITAFINGFGTAMLLPIIVIFLEDFYFLEPDEITLLIGVVSVLSIFGAPLGGKLSDSRGRLPVSWVSSVIGGLLMIMLCLKMSWGVWYLGILFFLRKVAASILQPSFRALQTDLIPSETIGKEFGMVQTFFNTGSVIGPIIGGLVYDLFASTQVQVLDGVVFLGAGYTFVISGLLGVIAGLLLKLMIKI